MRTIEVKFLMEVEDNAVEEVKKSVDHHIERLIDLENWPEIKSVYHATAKEVEMNEVRNE
jgi:hypothetical protein